VGYAGVVWCITVGHGAFIARRNGLIFATGNSGFPKSLDVSKAIDKRRDDKAAVQRVCAFLREAHRANPKPRREIDDHFGSKNIGGHWFTPDSPLATCPTWDQWVWLRAWLAFSDDMDAEVWRLNGRKGTPGEAWDQREKIGEKSAGIAVPGERGRYTVGGSRAVLVDVTAPATDDARTWQGWGTALKPAHEPIVVARKPLQGSVASNVLRHGTGAINVDGCRIGTGGGGGNGLGSHFDRLGNTNPRVKHGDDLGGSVGRWPSNVCLDEDQAAALDEMSGTLTSGKAGGYETRQDTPGDTGGASRFYYTAKATSAERPRENGIAHPTVKPLSLMRWLVRLVCPPGGTILEPFAGSGTTVEACQLEGFRCIAIEREADYLPLITSRLRQGVLDFEGLA
jgi:hypothetical protein